MCRKIFCYDQERENKKKELTIISRYELIESSIPVFIASGIATCVNSIISKASEHNSNADILELGLSGLYVIIMYFLGKYFTYMYILNKDMETSKVSSFIKFLKKHQLSKLFYHSASECSAFAWKEFLVILIFNIFYIEYGYGASFGMWIGTIFLATTIILVSNVIQKLYLKVEYEVNNGLLIFDSESMALSLAYITNIFIALGSTGIGFKFISDNSYLYTWEEDYSLAPDRSTRNTDYLIYAFFITLLVAFFMSLETNDLEDEIYADYFDQDEVDEDTVFPSRISQYCRLSSNQKDSFLHQKSQTNDNSNSLYLDGNSATGQIIDIPPKCLYLFNKSKSCTNYLFRDFFLLDSSFFKALKELWINYLSYLAGVAWFILIVDNFKLPPIPGGNELITNFVTVIIITLFITWKSPSCMATMKLRFEKTEQKFEEKRSKNVNGLDYNDDQQMSRDTKFDDSESNNQPNDQPDDQPSDQPNEIKAGDKNDSKKSYIWEKINLFFEYFILLNHKRRAVMILSLRIVIGWLWEVVIQEIFEIIGSEEDTLTVGAAIGIQIAIMFCIIIISLLVHFKIKDWNKNLVQSLNQQHQNQSDQELETPNPLTN